MRRHWSSQSNLVKYVRGLFGIEKPVACEYGAWEEWEQNTRRDHPIGFWLTEVLPRYLDKIPAPIDNLRYYARNRWLRQTHVLRTGFKPGTYHDLRERLLHGCMESLVDFVEIEKAWMWNVFNDDGKRYPYTHGRSIESGLKYLEWEISLGDPSLPEAERSPSQAESSREVLELYLWWKHKRPLRPDPYQEYSDYCDAHHAGDALTMLNERIHDDKIPLLLDAGHKNETAQEAEDEAMLIRLMKVRLALWT